MCCQEDKPGHIYLSSLSSTKRTNRYGGTYLICPVCTSRSGEPESRKLCTQLAYLHQIFLNYRDKTREPLNSDRKISTFRRSLIDSRCMLWFHPYMPWSEAYSEALEPPADLHLDSPYIEASASPLQLENPIRTCRKHLSATLEQFSQLTGVHVQAIHLLEFGCYYPILPRITQFIVDNHIMSVEDLHSAYSNFQFHQRGDFGRRHNFNHLTTVGDWDGDTSPFEEFRSQIIRVTRTALAKGLCVQPAALYRLANNEVKELPSLVQNALSEAGLSLDLVYELNERTREFYSVR